MKIGGVIKRFALAKNRQLSQILVMLPDMMEIGVRFPADIGQQLRSRPPMRGRFIVDDRPNFARNAPQPAQILLVMRYNQIDGDSHKIERGDFP